MGLTLSLFGARDDTKFIIQAQAADALKRAPVAVVREMEMILHSRRFLIRLSSLAMFALSCGMAYMIVILARLSEQTGQETLIKLLTAFPVICLVLCIYLWRLSLKTPSNEVWPPDLSEHPKILNAPRQALLVCASFMLILGAAYGIYVDDIVLPASRGRSMHLHGLSTWVAAVSLMFLASGFIAHVAFQHVGSKTNVESYRNFITTSKWVAGIGLALSAFANFFVKL